MLSHHLLHFYRDGGVCQRHTLEERRYKVWMQRGGGDLCVSPQELNMHDSYIMGTRGDIIL